ncbi:MAG TPA: cobalamin biosynthesis protein, partial [Nitrososphaeraceae archaeon]|nr:cobalamin biosynthesis protein [Nitrososphaeraceae archaeon]
GLVVTFGVIFQVSIFATLHFFGYVVLIVWSILFLKIAIAIKGMEKHIESIVDELQVNNCRNAQRKLAMIVKRDTDRLDEQHILSAMIECIGESIVDGIVSPLFYYTFLGPVGAFAYRIINTLDSMVGYKDDYYKNIGWMSAKLDTYANSVPARITPVLIVLSAKIIGADWKNSLRILERDHNKTLSYNAGYPMATMAGALRIKLEKIGQYSLGDGSEHVSIAKCRAALSIMKLTTIFFCIIVSIPCILALQLVGWWEILFGI